jgi:tetratricopeptide (TPR) repeat protein
LGETPDDPLMIFSVLYGFWLASFAGFDGDEMHELASQLLALAQKQSRIVPLMMAHRAMGSSSLLTGEFEVGRAHLDQAIALFDAAEHDSVDGQDAFASSLTDRSLALWILGHPEAALADAERVVADVRDIGRAVPLIYVLGIGSLAIIHCGDYATGCARFGEAIVLANEKGAAFWKAGLIPFQGCVLAITGKSSDAVEMIEGGLVAFRTMGSKAFIPFFLSHLARAQSELGQLEEAWRSIREAIRTVDTTKERWFEAEVLRIAGELALKSPETNAAKAVSYFERALAVARAQQARSWELRAAMSLARLWRGQGRRADAHDLLAPVYGWFIEGFDTLDLKEAKALLDELSS